MRLLRFVSLFSIVGLLLAACATEQVTAEEIMQRMRDARENLSSGHAVATVALDTPDRKGTFTVESWAKKTGQTDAAGKPIAKTRLEVDQSSDADLQGAVAVNDGETVWLYMPAEKRAVKGTLSELKEGGGGEDRMQQMLQLQEALQRVLDGSDVVLESDNELIAGKKTWRVRLTPKPETQQELQLGSVVNTLLWIDQENDLPLKARIDAGDLGSVEAEATSLELNQQISDDTFVFTPPPGTEVVDAAELIEQSRPLSVTLDEARKAVSFPVLTPEPLPAGVQLEEVQLMAARGETVIQNFGGSSVFSLVQAKGGFPGDERAPTGAQARTVTVRGHEATLISSGSGGEQGTLLRWEENEITIVVAGTISPDEAIAIAESLK